MGAFTSSPKQKKHLGTDSLTDARLLYQPTVPDCLKDLNTLTFKEGEATKSVDNEEELKEVFVKLYGQNKLTVERSALVTVRCFWFLNFLCLSGC